MKRKRITMEQSETYWINNDNRDDSKTKGHIDPTF